MRLRPLEALNLLAVALLSLLTLWLYERLPNPLGILLRYAGLLAGLSLVSLAARREDRLPPIGRLAVNFYPAAFLPLVFNSLGPLIEKARGPAQDDLLIVADRALLGVDATVWLQRFVRPLWNDFFYASYATYYFIALALGGLLWAADRAEARRFFFTVLFAYYVSYAGYFVIPALGPRYALTAQHSVSIETTRVSRAISSTIDRLEHTKFDVFPSGHTMIAVVVLIVAFQRMRKAFWFFLPITISLVISTVYCRYHYVVDVLAGIFLAFVTAPAGDRLYDRLVQSRRPPAISRRR